MSYVSIANDIEYNSHSSNSSSEPTRLIFSVAFISCEVMDPPIALSITWPVS